MSVALPPLSAIGAPSGAPPAENCTVPVGATGSVVPGLTVAVTVVPDVVTATDVWRNATEAA